MIRKIAAAIGMAALVIIVSVTPALAITWGELDTEHDNVGAMVVDSSIYGVIQWCSGTLIHPRLFLTAGHCTNQPTLDAYGISQVWVNFDEYALTEHTMLDVEQIITHPDYNWGPSSDPHDVALLVLEKPYRRAEPAVLPEPYYLDYLLDTGQLRQGGNEADFTVVGYGVQEPPGFESDDMRRVAYSEFQNLQPAWLMMSQNRATGDSGTCYGDSGGPGFWVNENGVEVIVGVTSWGDFQCTATGFDYRIDIPSSLDFIYSVIAAVE